MVAGGKGRAARRPDNAELAAPGLGVHIGFSTTGDWLSRVIRRITGSPVSHSFVVYHSAVFGKDMVLEASGHGFRVMAWQRFDKENKLVAMYRLKVPDPVLHEALGKLSFLLARSRGARLSGAQLLLGAMKQLTAVCLRAVERRGNLRV